MVVDENDESELSSSFIIFPQTIFAMASIHSSQQVWIGFVLAQDLMQGPQLRLKLILDDMGRCLVRVANKKYLKHYVKHWIQSCFV